MELGTIITVGDYKIEFGNIITVIVALIPAIASIIAAFISSRSAKLISKENAKHNEEILNLQSQHNQELTQLKSQLNQLEKIAERKFTKKANTLEQAFMHVANIGILMQEYCVRMTTLGRETGRHETLVQISAEFEKLHDYCKVNQIYIPEKERDILFGKIGELMGFINQFQNTADSDWQARQQIAQETIWPIIKETQKIIREELDS